MVLQGGGTIINVTSDAATDAYERWGAYGASKAALEQLGRVWAAELAGTGVRVVNVDPGEMDTRMHADAMPDADRAQLADPARVAADIVAMLQADPGPASGGRVAIRTGPQAAEASP
jgi:NAD(P)-dependent dehydrogenase (short-subunit alcohol dehydrogenase family)